MNTCKNVCYTKKWNTAAFRRHISFEFRTEKSLKEDLVTTL